MRIAVIGLWFVTLLAVSATADESVSTQEASADAAADPQSVESPPSAEEAADAEIRQIEEGVSDAKDVKEFTPTKPLSADKAIALPSDI